MARVPRRFLPLLLPLLLLSLAGCDSDGSGTGINTFQATISGARTMTLAGRAIGGPVTRYGETTYELTFTDLPSGQIGLARRSLLPLTVRTYVIGNTDDSFGGVVAFGDLSTFGIFPVESGTVVVDRLANRVAEGRISLSARSFEGEEVEVEGAFRLRLPD